mmetsp:Transcript_8941/g.27779  ORF Transcript_8941/g.27779 Transcript_8941/m.27779 type:complete len:256 (+) Transcript_8941:279-1046(+)
MRATYGSWRRSAGRRISVQIGHCQRLLKALICRLLDRYASRLKHCRCWQRSPRTGCWTRSMVIGQMSRSVSEVRHTTSSLSPWPQPCCFASNDRIRAAAAASLQLPTCKLSCGMSHGAVSSTAITKSETCSSTTCKLHSLNPGFRQTEMFCGTSRLLCPSSGGLTAKTSPPFTRSPKECGQAWVILLLSTLTIRNSTPRPSRRHCRSSGTSKVKLNCECVMKASFSSPLGSTTALKGSISFTRQAGHWKEPTLPV